jgi:hypothetical protein
LQPGAGVGVSNAKFEHGPQQPVYRCKYRLDRRTIVGHDFA